MRLTISILLLGINSHVFAQSAPAPQDIQSSIDPEIAKMVKMVSADSIKAYIHKMVSFETRHSLSDTVSDQRGIGAARRWVAYKMRQFSKVNGADMEVELDPYNVHPNSRIPYPVTMKNVLGTLKGTDPSDDRVFIVSGHLDSRNSNIMDGVGLAPGANDDASGVAVVLELARVMSTQKFPCTLIFMAVQGEEQGLLGARHMAEKLKRDRVNLVALLNNDIVGNSVASETNNKNNQTVRLFSERISASELKDAAASSVNVMNESTSRQLARYIKMISEPYVQGFTVTLNERPDRYLRGGDHTPFNQLGYTAVRFTEFNENFLHQHQNVRKENNVQYGDLPEFVDHEYAANVGRINLAALASLARAPGAPEKAEIKLTLGNMTYLSWQPPSHGPKPKGYHVLIRETFQPFWEKRFFITDTKISLPYSKDNYFFAVQSVGEKDHLSLIIAPTPVRE